MGDPIARVSKCFLIMERHRQEAMVKGAYPSEIGKFFIDSLESHVMYVLSGIDEGDESLRRI
jgi:hypothetical protein